ncbi:MAG: TlpA disulfide reductase family protein [Elusimicrobiota bacterium]
MRNLIAAAALALTVPASAQNLSDAFSSLSSQMAASRQAIAAARYVPGSSGGDASSPASGSAAPDFNLKTVSGQTYGLNDFNGRVVVIEFWASWSGPTKSAAPARTALARKWADSGVAMLDIGVGETGSGVSGFAAASAPASNETILLDADQSVFASYGGSGLPLAAVIDKNGNLAAVIPGADPARVDAAIRAALGN